MIHHPVLTGILLGIASILCVLCSLGLAVMRDPFQRLQYSAPAVSISISLIVTAIWIEDPQWQSRLKSLLILMILFLMNSVLNHATARAVRIRELDRLSVEPDEHIPLVGSGGEVGGGHPAKAEER